jgi:hypothetical protein
MLKQSLISALMVTLSACAAPQKTNDASDNSDNSDNSASRLPLTFYGHSIEGRNLIISVRSHGCTSAKDLAGKTSLKNGEQQLSLWRLRSDYCRRAPYAAQITIAAASLGLDLNRPFSISNPVEVESGKHRQ